MIDDWHDEDIIDLDNIIEDNPFYGFGEGYEDYLRQKAGLIEEEE